MAELDGEVIVVVVVAVMIVTLVDGVVLVIVVFGDDELREENLDAASISAHLVIVTSLFASARIRATSLVTLPSFSPSTSCSSVSTIGSSTSGGGCRSASFSYSFSSSGMTRARKGFRPDEKEKAG